MKETANNDPVPVHDTGQRCKCVRTHVPKVTHVHRHHILPKSWGGGDEEDNIVWLCPSTHEHVHILLRAYRQYEGTPPWEVRKQFNPYVREIAKQGWQKYLLMHVGRDLRAELGGRDEPTENRIVKDGWRELNPPKPCVTCGALSYLLDPNGEPRHKLNRCEAGVV